MAEDIVERLRNAVTASNGVDVFDGSILTEAAAEIARLRARVAELEAALRNARGMIAEWGAYASEYFQTKWGLANDLAAIDAALSKRGEPTA